MKSYEVENLQHIVMDITADHPEGINHAGLVKAVLQTGYQHDGNLSADLMIVIRHMIKEGIITKNLVTRTIYVNECQCV